MPAHSRVPVLKSLRSEKEEKVTTAKERNLFADLIRVLSFMLDLEEPRKLHHAWRTTIVATKMAGVMLPEQWQNVYYATLLHDVGVVGFADCLAHSSLKGKDLHIPGIWNHPKRGAEIVRCIPGLADCKRFVGEHHEWHNGEGYPDGKRGDQIAIGSQIIRIADSFDIWLREMPQISWRGMKTQIKTRLGKEYPAGIYDCFVDVLGKDDLYKMLVSDSHLSSLLKKIQARLPLIEIPPGIDAVGITLQVFAQVIDAKHKYTEGHSVRVAEYAMRIAEGMGVPHNEVTRVKWASLLHDMGKIAVPKSILDKPGYLTPEEFEVIKKHPGQTEEILGAMSYFRGLAYVAGHHHEHYDGTGYPDGLRGEKIPLLARIIAVADAFDGMTSTRPYQERKTTKQAVRALQQNAGTQFDPEVVNVASQVLTKKGTK